MKGDNRRNNNKDLRRTFNNQKIPLSITKKAFSFKNTKHLKNPSKNPRIAGKAIELLPSPKMPKSPPQRSRHPLQPKIPLKTSQNPSTQSQPEDPQNSQNLQNDPESPPPPSHTQGQNHPQNAQNHLIPSKNDPLISKSKTPDQLPVGKTSSEQKNKIEVKMDFDFLNKNQPKRTIFTKNRNSAKSFDISQAFAAMDLCKSFWYLVFEMEVMV